MSVQEFTAWKGRTQRLDRVPESPRATACSPPPTTADRLARRFLLNALARIDCGQLIIAEGGREHACGVATESTSPVRLEVHHPRFFRSMMLGGDLGAAESYLAGDWSTPDLVPLFDLLVRNDAVLRELGRGWSWLSRPATAVQRWARRNTRWGSRRNIHAHYDLGNDFFRLFLDETMTYSSGIFAAPASSLHDASVEKYDRICRRLRLTPEHHVMEIGTGWGGFVEHAVRNYGCRVTSTTISQEQYEFARARVEALGLGDRVTLCLQDYRDLSGQYDRLVSIEMIEAVGHEYLPAYFRKCNELLRPGGEMIIQAITIPDQRYDAYRKSQDFIQRYIFPGGCLPSLGAICQAIAGTPRLRLVELFDFAPDYARTLRLWRERFHQRRDEVLKLQKDERFVRMWDYYLAYCEVGFHHGLTGVSQLHFHA